LDEAHRGRPENGTGGLDTLGKKLKFQGFEKGQLETPRGGAAVSWPHLIGTFFKNKKAGKGFAQFGKKKKNPRLIPRLGAFCHC